MILILSLMLGVFMPSVVAQTTPPDRNASSKPVSGPASGAISQQPQPLGPADKPAARNDDPTWVKKHVELVERAKRGDIDLYFAGDSITRRWEGEVRHKANWDQNFGGWKAASFGAGGDRTQNVLYRIENGELDGVNPKVIVLLIGTNNLGFVPVEGSDAALVQDIANGIKACLNALRQRAPKARILLIGITPNDHLSPGPNSCTGRYG